MKVHRLLLISLTTLTLTEINGQSRFDKMANSDLFSDTTVLEVTLEFDINTVVEDIEERLYHPAKLNFHDPGAGDVSIDLKLKIRGKTRANPKVCKFPPIRLNFKKGENDDNLFAGQDKLKLVDHCQDGKNYQDYIIGEYLVYKMHSLITEKSFRVRLLKIKYVDTGGKEEPFTKYGFLIEDEEAMAVRNGMIAGGKVSNQDRCNQTDLDILTVFQFLIGNTDWGVAGGHNVKLMAQDSTFRLPTPIPYDFDYSGMINAHYAVPPPTLPIETVRARLFRGYCRQPGTYEKVFELFNSKKDDIFELYNSDVRLSTKSKKGIIKYLDSFYDILNDPKKAARSILKVCEIDHRHVY